MQAGSHAINRAVHLQTQQATWLMELAQFKLADLLCPAARPAREVAVERPTELNWAFIELPELPWDQFRADHMSLLAGKSALVTGGAKGRTGRSSDAVNRVPHTLAPAAPSPNPSHTAYLPAHSQASGMRVHSRWAALAPGCWWPMWTGRGWRQPRSG